MTSSIHTIDLRYLGQERAIAAYLIESNTGPILVETGPANTVDTLTTALAALGVAPADIRHALVTHIHFDHAGAVGWLARHGTHIYVHEFGAPHLIDPSKLVDSARRIYGAKMDYEWGIMTAVPADQVRPVRDGDVLEFGDVTLTAIETPGHARHHHAYRMDTDDGAVAFTGDAAATYMSETSFINLPMPPPEFDLDAWLATLDRLRAANLARIYPTHFGACDHPAAHFDAVTEELHRNVACIERLVAEGLSEADIVAAYGEWMDELADAADVPLARRPFYVSRNIKQMNVMGVLRYKRKRAERAHASRLSVE
ncbi:MAG: MBL fold metallo-hydrolase [Phycisphaerales bacterium]|nr:MBL fold metallo-hydrolase [Phycisphaerales bacterium]